MTKEEMVAKLTNGCYTTDDLVRELTCMRDAMARYYLASPSLEYDQAYCHERYEFATLMIDLLTA